MANYRITRVEGRANWHIAWTENGSTKRRSTRTDDKVQAQAVLEDIIEAASAPGGPTSLTTGAVIEAYIADREQVVVAPQALKDRAKPILRTFRDKLPRHIRKEHCRSYVAARRNSGISDATIRTELGFLSTALNYASITAPVVRLVGPSSSCPRRYHRGCVSAGRTNEPNHGSGD